MNVLSLFDGMSCGQIALKELNIHIDTYYASEIDKFAIKQTQLNFPNTIQVGDVRKVNVLDLQPIDLLIGGSPCTNLSFAGTRKGLCTKENIEILSLGQYLELKEQGFEFEGQSYLFWEYMRILTEIREYNPNVLFLLENVEMGKKWESVFNKAIETQGIHINSSLVSAQNRRRIYWTNINDGNIPQPKDREIFFRHIAEEEVEEKYYLSEKMMNWLKRHGEKRNTDINILGDNDKSRCLTATAQVKGNLVTDYVCFAPRRTDRKGKTGSCSQNPLPFREICMSCGHLRRLTPTECARLQTIPEWYKWQCSNTQQYKMLSNGWTVEVIKHIFGYMIE